MEDALTFLKSRDRFEREVRERLDSRGHGSEVIDLVVSHLIRRKLIEDRRTTQNLVARMSGKRAAGVEKLRAELNRRGAPEEIIEECLAELSPVQQRKAMLDALSAKFKPADDRVRGARFLLSRGFVDDEIEGPLDEFFRQD